jgi:small-conductance mechanosensitive channel
LLWSLLLGVATAITFVSLGPAVLLWLQRGITAIGYGSVTLFLIAVAAWLIHSLAERFSGFRPIAGMTERMTQIVAAAVGAMLVLNALTVPITPLLTTLGVAGLATALALQDTLSNFFAGFYLLADRPIQPGDFVRLDTGDEGYVLEVGWRSTRLRTLPNNIVILPNQRLSHAIITNYSLPDTRVAVVVRVGVAYDSDPDQVERVLEEVGVGAVGEIGGLLAHPPPVARFSPGFGEYSLDFSLVCHAAQYTDQFFVQHELRKRIFRRFREDGITFAVPTRRVVLDANDFASVPLAPLAVRSPINSSRS